jgi:DNA-binding NarL/FixJ family response regulator
MNEGSATHEGSANQDNADQDRAKVRVVVADDQRVVREGLVTVLSVLPGFEVVGSAADGEQALALVARHLPQVVLMDLRMPRLDGVEATRRIRAAHPGTAVVVLTTYADDESILAALRAGATGYLTKDAGREQIARAVHAAAGGQAILDPAVQARLVAAAGPGPDARPARPLPDGLTAREAEVLSLIAAGRTNAQIAAALVISPSTVKTHINNIFAKAGISDRAQAVHYAYQHELADTSRP